MRPLWAGRAVALLGILILALSLRSAVSAISPIVAEISVDIPLSSIGLGLLGALPPVFFALAGIIAPPIAKRVGLELTILLAVAAIVVGHLIRAFADSYGVLAVGSSLALAAMGIANVLLPPAVKRYFPDRIGGITAAYVTIMSVSTSLPALGAAPIAAAYGWRMSLGIWSVTAAIAAVPWVLLLVGHRLAREQGQEHHGDHRVGDADGGAVQPGGVRGQGDEHEHRVLEQGDEEQIQQRERPARHPAPQDRPAVVLGAGVAALAAEIEGQTHAPQGDQHGHEGQAGIREARGCREDPDVHDRQHRPEPVDPGVVARQHGERPGHDADRGGDEQHTGERCHVPR